MTVKKRSKITDDFKSRSWVYETAGTSREHLFTDSEYVQSTGHRISQLRSGDDIGGPFTSRKAYCENLDVGPFTANSGPYHYAGPLFPAVQNWKGDTAVWPSDASASSNYSLDMFGTHAISAVLPTNPVGDAATFLGELREGIPKLIGSSLFKSRLRDLRNVGDEYLNVQFGWKPFVKDLQKFATGVKDHNVILEQLIRDSGRNVRRRYSGAPEVTTVETSRTGIYPQPAQTTALHNGSGTQVTTTRIERKRWFSGAFTYHLETGSDKLSQLKRYEQEANKLLGIRITPEVLWNLAPWSWAIDWAANTGDVLHNYSALSNDGLVIRYGYVMEHTHYVQTVTLLGAGMHSSQTATYEISPTQKFHFETKVRRRATPFGFGFDMNTLSASQEAIIAALGISRVPR